MELNNVDLFIKMATSHKCYSGSDIKETFLKCYEDEENLGKLKNLIDRFKNIYIDNEDTKLVDDVMYSFIVNGFIDVRSAKGFVLELEDDGMVYCHSSSTGFNKPVDLTYGELLLKLKSLKEQGKGDFVVRYGRDGVSLKYVSICEEEYAVLDKGCYNVTVDELFEKLLAVDEDKCVILYNRLNARTYVSSTVQGLYVDDNNKEIIVVRGWLKGKPVNANFEMV